MAQAPFPQLVNFVAASRKPALIPSNYFSPGDSVSWIWAPAASGGGVDVTPVTLVGVVDGVNRIFVVPTTILTGAAVLRNGVVQIPTTSYSLIGQTVTFVSAPQVGDDLQAIVS